jgi:hypothetical protein
MSQIITSMEERKPQHNTASNSTAMAPTLVAAWTG